MRSLALLALAACGSSGDTHRTAPLASDGTHLRDDRGRIALLRGINARVGGIFDVTFSDGRTPLEPIPDLLPPDCRRMRELGLDLLRLPINWSGIEPARGTFDETYLARVDAAIACAGNAGMFVLIDLHQDAYSKEIGEDGAPLWAIQPPPTQLLQGPLLDLDQRRVSTQVQAAFATFFAPGSDVQAAFLEMLDRVAARWADAPAVIGFELFNEPVVGDADLAGFSEAAAARVRAAAPDKLVMFEPSAVRNLLDAAPRSDHAFAVRDAVYAPHVYTYVFYSDPSRLQQLAPADLEASVAAARDEATAWKTPLVIGEYGIGPTQPNADLWMATEAQLHDRYLASDAFWLWKEQSQGSWGVFDHEPVNDDWIERPQVVHWISRIHAARIAGSVVANEYDPASGSLTLTTKHAGSTPHVIYTPSTAFTATCNGAGQSAPRDPATGQIEIACDGTLVVSAAP